MFLEKKKNAIMNTVQSGGRLPSEYQEVEYIGSVGKSYIKTGIKTNLNLNIISLIRLSSRSNSKSYFFL